MKVIKNVLLVFYILFQSTLFAQSNPKNIIVYIDLSDRLARENQIDIDKKLILKCINEFKDNAEKSYKGGRLWSSDAFSIHFNPPMHNQSLASNLSIDFSQISDVNNRVNYFVKQFPEGQKPVLSNKIDSLYVLAQQQHPRYPGSDLFKFLREDLPHLMKSTDPVSSLTYDNYLIILTDGYVYMNKSFDKRNGNVLGHLEGCVFDPLRNNPNWESQFDSQKWGLASTGKLFKNLNVLALQFVPDCIVNTAQPRTCVRPLKPSVNEFQILTKL